ncbi:MAG TPA: GGDEF domain-containing protein [bacterium]|nr:GGDEF domain-containing protein [bacterium]HOL47167.1 GGDEF domain-containing protein [bacterium]HPQ18090.1 GGDEF domain-containing protein [bacterium]
MEKKDFEKLKMNYDLIFNIIEHYRNCKNINEFLKITSKIFFTKLNIPANFLFFNLYKISTESKYFSSKKNDKFELYTYEDLEGLFATTEQYKFLQKYLNIYEEIFVNTSFTEVEDIYFLQQNLIVFWFEEIGYIIIGLDIDNIKFFEIIDKFICHHLYNTLENALKSIKLIYEMEQMNNFLSENIDRIGEFELISRYILGAQNLDSLIKRTINFLKRKSFRFNDVIFYVNYNQTPILIYSTENDDFKMIKNFNIANIKQYLDEYKSDIFNLIFSNTNQENEDDLIIKVDYLYFITTDRFLNVLLFFDEFEKGHIEFLKEKLLFLINNFESSLKKFLYYEYIKELSEKDGLTGVYNHSYFQNKLKSLIESKKNNEIKDEITLLFFDMDDFKQINDKFGHIYGDTILKKVANILKSSLPENSILARYGGDEFVALVFNQSSELIEEIIKNKIFKDLNNLKDEEKNISISVSVGIGNITANIGNKDELLKQVDTAMYNAKRKGKNRFEYS